MKSLKLNIWVKRPAIWVTCAYMAGILLSFKVHIESTLLIFLAAALCLTAAALGIMGRWKNTFSILLGVFFILGSLNAGRLCYKTGSITQFDGRQMLFEGQIIDYPNYKSDKDVYTVKVNKVTDGKSIWNISEKLRLTIYSRKTDHRHQYTYGDIIEFSGEVLIPQCKRNPKGFDYRAFLKRQGIYSMVNTYSFNTKFIQKGNLKTLSALSHKLGLYAGQQIDKIIGGVEGDFIKAIILGQKWLLLSDIMQDFSRNGLAHIISISGLHVGFILAMIEFFTYKLFATKKTAFFINLFVLILYCTMIGAPPSAVRAVIMAVIYLGGKMLDRTTDPINTISIAAFVILLLDPLYIMDIGFQLSFLAVLGIILYYEMLKDKLSCLPKFLAQSLSMTLSAQIGVLPVIVYYFNILSFISVIANLTFVPLAGVLVIGGFLTIFLSFIPGVGVIAGRIVKFICMIMIRGSKFLAALPMSFTYVVSPSIIFIICYYILVWIFSMEGRKYFIKPYKYAAIAAAIMILSLVIPYFDNSLKVVFVDVGQGDCIYIKTPDRKNILIDAGGTPKFYLGDFDTGENIVLPFLLKNGVSGLDMFIMSHSHDDHIGGAKAVVEALPIKNFMYFPSKEQGDIYSQLLSYMKEKNVRLIKVHGGQTYKIGRDFYLDIFFPIMDKKTINDIYNDNENNLSVVLKARCHNASILFTGDIEGEVEKCISSHASLQAQILKVAHHGSNTSSSDEFIKSVQPSLAVIQVGKNNFGHPASEVIKRLENRGAKVLRNDQNGGITCAYKNGSWKISKTID